MLTRANKGDVCYYVQINSYTRLNEVPRMHKVTVTGGADIRVRYTIDGDKTGQTYSERRGTFEETHHRTEEEALWAAATKVQWELNKALERQRRAIGLLVSIADSLGVTMAELDGRLKAEV